MGTELVHKKRVIISFVGKQGSGKTTLGKQVAKYAKTIHIETSDVVKDLNKGLSREELPSTGKRTKKNPDWLGEALRDRIETLSENSTKPVAISGIREIEVQRYLEQYYDMHNFEVTADPEIRFQRLYALGKVDSAVAFLEHEVKEAQLGVNEVEEAAPYHIPTSPETDPAKIVKAIVRELIKRKVSFK